MTRVAWCGALAVFAITMLWVAPVVGAVLFAVAVATVPPWGRTFAERAIVSTIVVVGATAVLFPRAGSTPVNDISVRVFLTIVMVVLVALNFLPTARRMPFPRPRVVDGLLLILVVTLWLLLVTPFIVGTNADVISGLYFAGWDNHGHYTTFANTYMSESTTWPTTDGSVAWNQWYPSLHSTLWALGTFLVSGAGLGRVGLLIPYVQWSAATFVMSIGALAWVATDIAERWVKRVARRRAMWASGVAFGVFAAWVFLGSPQFLFNAGFTNFVMGAALMGTASYLAVRSPRGARTLGWFIVPLAAVATIGLWTPLVVGLVPAGVIVAVAMIRHRVTVGVIWLVATVGIVLFVSARQLGDVLSAGGQEDAAEFARNIGEVAVGMAPFNVTAAIVAPITAVAIAVLVHVPWTTRWGLAGPSVATATVALVFVPGAVAAGVWWLDSYYVQKALNAALLVTAPIIAAAVGVGLILALRWMSSRQAVAVTLVVGLVGLSTLGLAGTRQEEPLRGLPQFPGFEAIGQRYEGRQAQWLGELIVAGVDATEGLPEFAPVLWEGPGTLSNLWTGSIHGTLSRTQQVFYLSLPQPPEGEDAAAWAKEALSAFPRLRIAFVPPTEESAEFLRLRFGSADPRRVVVVGD
ncbi:MAG TPA: hypothetical protein DGF10_02600 [Acidimicrobiaceae bacterium]|nr:hypothetical protein [Acidimicrobiaceae bacterium]